MDLAEYRTLFPSIERQVYLNHAACSPLPLPAFEAMKAFLEEHHLYGCRRSKAFSDVTENIRSTAARFLGASADEMALTRNTSHGLLLVANGLAWKEGDNIVTAETEFPANVYPWVTLKPKGVELRFAPQRDGRVLPEDIEALVDDRTRLVAISAVEFVTGFRNDLRAIGDICRRHGALLSVDAIQALGQMPFDVKELRVDFASAGGAKWLMGPLGTAVFYCRKPLIEALEPTFMSWRSTVDPEDYFRYDLPWAPTARRFEEATLNLPGLVGLQASMEMLLDAGLERIREHLLRLTDQLAEGLRDRGCSITTPTASVSERSGILCFKHPRVSCEEIHAALDEANVVVSHRGDIVRVSPHFYNTAEDIDRLLRALP